MSSVAERLTADEYFALEDPRRTELVDGVVVVNEPGLLHQHVCGLIYVALNEWIETSNGSGTVWLPLDVPLDDYNVLAPDVLWFQHALPLSAAHAPRPPDLAVEVRSPGTWRYDIGRKRELYGRHGVRELWLADTASRTMLVCRGDGFEIVRELTAEETLSSPLLRGFAMLVGEVLPQVG